MNALETTARALMASIEACSAGTDQPLAKRISNRLAATEELRKVLAEQDGQPLTPPMSAEANGFWWLWHEGEWLPALSLTSGADS